MNALPGVYLTWDPSEEAADSFLRYQVYRRLVGDTSWSKLARITDQAVAFYSDYRVPATGDDYEYAVTQVIDVGGEEVESEFPSLVSASTLARSTFLHPVSMPERYVEYLANVSAVAITPEVVYLQPWSRRLPTAHISPVQRREYQVDAHQSWLDYRELWETMRDFVDLQYDAGAVFLLRHARTHAYVQIDSLNREDDGSVMFNAPVRFTEVFYREEVD